MAVYAVTRYGSPPLCRSLETARRSTRLDNTREKAAGRKGVGDDAQRPVLVKGHFKLKCEMKAGLVHQTRETFPWAKNGGHVLCSASDFFFFFFLSVVFCFLKKLY